MSDLPPQQPSATEALNFTNVENALESLKFQAKVQAQRYEEVIRGLELEVFQLKERNKILEEILEQGKSSNFSEVTVLMPGQTEVNPTHISAIPPEVIGHVFEYLGPLDLNACRKMCRVWRGVVNTRTKNFVKYVVKSEDDLEGLALLKAENPDFGIQELELSYRTPSGRYNTSLLSQFIQQIPRVSLGKLTFFRPKINTLNSTVLEEILERFPNLFHLEEAIKASQNDPNDISFLYEVKDPITGRMKESHFPNIRNLVLPHRKLPLAIILKHLPNLRYLSMKKLGAPYLTGADGSRLERLELEELTTRGCEQLRAIGLSLRQFVGSVSESKEDGIGNFDPDIEEVRILIEVLREFLLTQTSTLKDLSLNFNVYWRNQLDQPRFDLFPCYLPGLTKLKTALEFSSNTNHILESVPQLQSLVLDHCSTSISSFAPDEGGPRIHHDGVKELEILQDRRIDPMPITDIPFLAQLFPNLDSLELGEVGRGLLPIVYQELANLISLTISESFSSGEALQVTDFNSNTEPKGPWIGQMERLKDLKFRFNSLERSIDSIVRHGLIDVVGRLDSLIFENGKFSENTVDLLASMMELKSKLPELSEDGHYYGDFEFVRQAHSESEDLEKEES